MSPGMELFCALYERIEKKHSDRITSGSIARIEKPYPFIHLGDVQELSDFQVKGGSFGQASVAISVWHNNSREQGVLDSLLFDLRQCARQIEYTDSYGWGISGVSVEKLRDTTTSQPLMRGILNLEYRYYRRTK